jgi:[glutamine synthetase] adenylyltransferase / [glutamine synthetase]-adenylyl-L-tyrosine phosphorylase
VEFIAQVLQLIHARDTPELCSPTTRIALDRFAKARLLPAEDAALLIRADHIWRTVQGMLRITVGRGAPDDLPDASARAVLRAVAAAFGGEASVDLAGLRATLDDLARQVRAMFVRHVGEMVP